MGEIIQGRFGKPRKGENDEWMLGDEVEVPGISGVFVVTGFTADGDPILTEKQNIDDGPFTA